MSGRKKRIEELEMLITEAEGELALLLQEEEEEREPTAAEEYEDRREHERAHGPGRLG